MSSLDRCVPQTREECGEWIVSALRASREGACVLAEREREDLDSSEAEAR